MKVYIKERKGTSVKEIRSAEDNSVLKKFISTTKAAYWIYYNGYELVEEKVVE